MHYTDTHACTHTRTAIQCHLQTGTDTHTRIHARAHTDAGSNGVMYAGNISRTFGKLAGATAARVSSAYSGVAHRSPTPCVAPWQSCSLLWSTGCGSRGTLCPLVLESVRQNVV